MPIVSHSKEAEEEEEEEGDDDVLLALVRQVCCSISEEYFPDRIVMLMTIDHYNDNVVSYFRNLYNTVCTEGFGAMGPT